MVYCSAARADATTSRAVPADKAHLIYSLTSLLGKRGLVVASDEANAMRICEDINRGKVSFPVR